MQFFQIYQYIAPVVMFPLAFWLFSLRYAGDRAVVIALLAIPIGFSYVIPALGMNWLRLWEMSTRLRIGRIRPHHGFMFGSATSLFVPLCLSAPTAGMSDLEPLRAGFVLGSVVAFWNWLYDIIAIRVGFIRVYNRPWSLGQGAEAVATDYAPTVFGLFGVVYGAIVRLVESWVVLGGQREWLPWLVIAGLVAGVGVPVMVFVAQSYFLHGESGLETYEGRGPADS